VADHLDRHVPDDPDALVFTTPAGTPLRSPNFRCQVWYRAVEKAELPQGMRIHDLRRTCAGLLAAAGATPKAVQVHLGHSSITVTIDRYTQLFPSDVDDLMRRLNDIRTRNARPSRGPETSLEESNLAADERKPGRSRGSSGTPGGTRTPNLLIRG